MSEQLANPSAEMAAWNTPLEAFACEYCHWSFLADSTAAVQCPHCHRSKLIPISDYLSEMPHPY
ncbi:MAG: hypothetical protein IH586_12720, partial [Anaerolineaceae bacterium]|nr:hypothetical protein [Anaerolineaceae bacterium]